MKQFGKVIKWLAREMKSHYIKWLVFIVLASSSISLFNVIISLSTKYLIDGAQRLNWKLIWISGIVFVGLMLLRIVVNAITSIHTAKFSASLSNKLRKDIFSGLSSSDWSEFSKLHSDDILTRMTSDIDVVVAGISNTIPNIIAIAANIVAALAVLLYYEPLLALLAFVVGPAGVIFSRFFAKKIKTYHKKMQETQSRMREYLHESLQNMFVVKAFSLEEVSVEKIDKLQKQNYFYTIRRTVAGVSANIILSLTYSVGYCLALFFGIFRMAVSRGTFTFGTFSAFLQLVSQIQGPFSSLASYIPQLIQAYASTERLIELGNLQTEIMLNATDVKQIAHAGLILKSVSFAYSDEKRVFDRANLIIKPGEIVAVVGPSGEGKTTLINLILALLNPQKGQIFLTDEHGTLIPVDSQTRRNVSYVPQGDTLFSGSISHNLRIGCPDATEVEMINALKDACAWSFVEKLPDKLDAKIGEHGIGLSQGQAQRITIARAFLKKAPLLILDEATSALDMHTELEVLRSIRNTGKTCIIITHRPSALDICNRTYRVESGAIVSDADYTFIHKQ